MFLGISDESNEVIVGTEEGVVKGNDLRRRGSDEERYNVQKFNGFRGVPWETTPGTKTDVIGIRVQLPKEEGEPGAALAGEERMTSIRRFRIQDKDFEVIGLTVGCPGCRAIEHGRSGARGAARHNEECRRRVEEDRKARGDPRIQQEEERLMSRYEERHAQLEENENKRRKVAQGPEAGGSASSSSGTTEESRRRKREEGDEHEEERGKKNVSVEEEEEKDRPPLVEAEEDKDIHMGYIASMEVEEDIDEDDEEFEEPDIGYAAPIGYAVNLLEDMWLCSAGVNTQRYWDDMSGKELRADLIAAAREEEMKEVYKHKLYTKVPLQQCWDETGKDPIGTRWVDVNKGDDEDPEYRCRLVAQEINRGKREDLFAATPPLEGLKVLFSLAVTEGTGFGTGSRRGGMKLDFIDVRRAYFHAKARRRVYVRLPAEDAEPGMCGLLGKAMYGTQDAAQCWEYEYCDFMIDSGFDRGMGSPCVFYHELRQMWVVVHGEVMTSQRLVALVIWIGFAA